MEKQTIEITVTANLEFSSLVRQISANVFSHAGLTHEWACRLKLVVDELFMNAVRYGSKKDISKVYLSYSHDGVAVEFTVQDEGAGESKLAPAELEALIKQNDDSKDDLSKTSGRGLAMISTLWTDELKVEKSQHGGLSVSFKKAITKDAPPAPPIMAAVQAAAVPASTSPVAPQGPAETIALDGEIDGSNMEAKIKPVEEKLKAMSGKGILTLDCSQLKYFNSTFIGHLAAWHNELSSKGGQLVLNNANKEVKEVLDLVGLSKVVYTESQKT